MQQGRRSAKPQVIVFMIAISAVLIVLYSNRLFDALSSLPASNAQSIMQRPTTNEFIRQEAQLLDQIRADPQNASPYRALGQLYLQVERYERALVTFNEALARDAASAVAYLRRGMAYAGLTDLANASADYERALSLAPDLATTVSAEYLALAHATQNPTFALAYLSRALELAPRLELFTERGHVYAALGDLTNAATDYENALRLTDVPQVFGGYFYNLGQLAENAGLHEDAITYFDRAIALNDEESTFYYMRGRVYDVLGQSQVAMQDYERGIALSDDLEPTILRDLASRAFEAGNYAGAINFYTRLIEINPNDLSPYRQRVVSYHYAGDNSAAFVDLNTMVERFPDNPQVYRDVAWMSVQVENFEQALRFYTLAYELDPENLDTYRQIGRAHLSLGQTAQALTIFTTIVQRQPDNPQSYRDLGFMYQMMGDNARAIEAFSQVLTLSGTTVQDYITLATLYVENDQRQLAINVYAEAVTMNPDNVLLRREIAWLYAQNGQTALARAHYDVALGLAPNAPNTYREIAHFYQYIGELDTARAYYERVIELAPQDPRSYDDLAQFLVNIGQPTASIPYFTTALEGNFVNSNVSGGVAGVVERRAEAYFAIGDLNNAISDYEYLLASEVVVNTRLAEIYTLRANRYQQASRDDLALVDYERAFALQPDNLAYRDSVVDLRFQRGVNAYNNGNYDLAIADFERLIWLQQLDIEALRYSAYFLRAEARENAGLFTLALEDYRVASESPNHAPSALLRAGDLYYRLGQHEESLQAYRAYFQLVGGAPQP